MSLSRCPRSTLASDPNSWGWPGNPYEFWCRLWVQGWVQNHQYSICFWIQELQPVSGSVQHEENRRDTVWTLLLGRSHILEMHFRHILNVIRSSQNGGGTRTLLCPEDTSIEKIFMLSQGAGRRVITTTQGLYWASLGVSWGFFIIEHYCHTFAKKCQILLLTCVGVHVQGMESRALYSLRQTLLRYLQSRINKGNTWKTILPPERNGGL